MPPRATSELLLVGSLPAESTESALRAAGELFCDLVFALPDGETGRRRAWVGYERERLCRPHPDLGRQRDGVADGDPAPRVRDARLPDPRGVDELRFERWPRIDDAIESYRTFVALRDEGAVPRGLRFQVGLPFPASALNAFKADHSRDYPAAPRGVRGPRRAGARAADGGDPAGRARDPVGRLLRGARPGGRPRLDGRRRVGALR